MRKKIPRDVEKKILGKVPLSRRSFVKRMIGGAFAAPLVTSFSLDRLTFGGPALVYAQSNIPPGSNIFCDD